LTDIPSRNECLEILQEAGCSEPVIIHCKLVCRGSLLVGKAAGADLELVEAGALLHDLGRARTHGLTHAVVGAEMATKLGLPEPIIRIIRRHLGSGMSAEEAKSLGLPAEDCFPETPEERIVCHVDSLAAADRFRTLEQTLTELRKKGLGTVAERAAEMHRRLSRECGEDPDILLRTIWPPSG